MPSQRPIIAALLTAAALLPRAAIGYERSVTCDPDGRDEPRPCRPGEESIPVAWQASCLRYYVHRDGAADYGGLSEELERAIDSSFTAWLGHGCGLALEPGGLTCNTNIGRTDLEIRGGNQNLIIWRDLTWDHTSSVAIGVTTTTTKADGELIDADIEMNGVHFDFGDADRPEQAARTDVRNTLVHEIGHLLGFAHEPVIPASTMFPDAEAGELIKRDLDATDVDGLCAVYPPSVTARCDAPTLVDESCTLEGTGSPGCAALPQRAPRAPAIPFFLGLALWTVRRRRCAE